MPPERVHRHIRNNRGQCKEAKNRVCEKISESFDFERGHREKRGSECQEKRKKAVMEM